MPTQGYKGGREVDNGWTGDRKRKRMAERAGARSWQRMKGGSGRSESLEMLTIRETGRKKGWKRRRGRCIHLDKLS